MPETLAETVRELRLAVVLYGGVSLAIYMHGTTKELHRLVRASMLADGRRAAATPSEGVYRDLLEALKQRTPDGVRTRVVVDIIAGTSAGGINGVYLAKALAHDLSQEALRDLWLDRGDITKLLRGWAWIPVGIKLPVLLAQAKTQAPLDGDRIARWMYEALAGMDSSAPDRNATLMPEGHLLELFVTATDYAGYQRDLQIFDPKLIHDEAHRHVFVFRFGPGEDNFRPASNAALTLAARTTMSFPGAFSPVNLRAFARALQPATVDQPTLKQQLFRIYELSRANIDRAQFIDGGVLDNRPFRHAIDAIARRPSEGEVDRKLLYLEPDPAPPVPAAADGPVTAPGPLATALAAVAGIPRKEPILDDILEVQRTNERVRRIRDIIEARFDEVGAWVRQTLGLGELTEFPTADQFSRWNDQINAAASQTAGLSYETYMRCKVDGVVNTYVGMICRVCGFPEDSNQAAFVRATIREWSRSRLYSVGPDDRGVPADDQVKFLRTFDLDFGARRLRFVIDALSWWFGHLGEPGIPTRAQLSRGKRELHALREQLTAPTEGPDFGVDLTHEVFALFNQQPIDDWVYRQKKDAPAYVAQNKAALTQLEAELGRALERKFQNFGATVRECLTRIAADWSARARGDLLVRYLGFPMWDIMLYPLQALADVGERDAIDVIRMSPKDSRLTPPLQDNRPALYGVGLGHFGAFFKRAGRETDYLWGRFDGAERLIGMLLGDGAQPAELEHWCRQAFAAIAEEEHAALTTPEARALVDRAREYARSPRS